MDKTRVRVREMKAAFDVLEAMNKGHFGTEDVHVHLSGGKDPATFLRGLLNMGAVAAMGHSYGGATIAALCAEDPRFGCAVALDPWW